MGEDGAVPGPAAPTDPPPTPGVLADERLTAVGLLVEAQAALVRVLDAELRRDVGMPLSTYEALIRLGRSPGRRLRQVELSRQLSLTTGGITRMIDRLEAAGLVRRTTSAADRRASYAQLTELGLETLVCATEVHLVSLQRHLVDPLGAEGVAALTAPLRRLRDVLAGDPADRVEPADDPGPAPAVRPPVGADLDEPAVR